LKEGHGALSQIFGGWQISSIVNVRSGVPLRITQSSGISQSRPDYNGADAIFDNWGDTLLYLNKAAFTPVPTSTVTNATLRPGTANPSLFRGPGRWTVDMAIGKMFRITEGVSLQIRGDAFNAFNHVNYGNPVTSLSNVDFGRITSAGGWRSGQLSARLTF
jgi:hypothetical protein